MSQLVWLQEAAVVEAAAFSADDATEAMPKGSDKAKAAWVKMANKAVGRGMSKADAGKAATKMAGQMQEAHRTHLNLVEVGRVLSSANEKQLQTAAAAIASVLKALDSGDEPAPADVKAAEAYSGEANDAARGVGVVTSIEYAAQSLLYLISDEADEPDQVAMLQKAYEGLMAVVPSVLAWVTAEIGEIGGPDDESGEAPASDFEESAADLLGDTVPLVESAVRPDGTMNIKLIQPGWGATGYYSEAVLRRDGPKVFTAGTKMFIDHPGYAEEADRPERSLKDIGAFLAADAMYQEAGPAGPGLYAPAKPVREFAPLLEELAPNIGTSIRMKGTLKSGEAEGKKGPIVERIIADPLGSVDFVTVAGAGGQIVSLAESWRKARETTTGADLAAGRRTVPPQEVSNMDLLETQTRLAAAEKERDTALTEGARDREKLILREARDVVVAELASAQIPDITRGRLTESLGKNPPVKDGQLDAEALKASVKESVAAEVDYLAKITGSGQVRGMGGAGTAAPVDVDASLNESFRALGMTESGAKIAAAGRR
jgi:hypothetical protein